MKAGAVDFLSKPVDRGALLAAVQRALARDCERRAANEQKHEAEWLVDEQIRRIARMRAAGRDAAEAEAPFSGRALVSAVDHAMRAEARR